MQLSNPFDELAKPGKSEVDYEEWGGQFSCQKYPCGGWANVAKYFPNKRLLVWECQDGHRSYIEDFYE